MNKYCITAARPKNPTHHLNSEFKLWKSEKVEDDASKWVSKGWQRAAEIPALLDAGNEVLTGKKMMPASRSAQQ